MNRRSWQSRTAVIVGLFVLFPFAWGSSNYFGFCITKLKSFSTMELMAVAFDHLNRPRVFPNGQRVVPYESFSQFIATNPGCCEVLLTGPGFQDVTPIDRLTGRAGYKVSVNYLTRFQVRMGIRVAESQMNRFSSLSVATSNSSFE